MKLLRRLIPPLLLAAVVFFLFTGSALAAPAAQEPTPDYGVITSTPNPDGSIIHIVREGESCWTIAMAYGLTCSQIQVNSGNSAEAQEVYIGSRLIIRPPFTPTPTNNNTPTPTRITPNPTLARPTRTPQPSPTLRPTPTATIEPPFLHKIFADSQKVGLTMAALSAVGLIVVIIFGFLRNDD